MPTLSVELEPQQPALGLLPGPQLCYLLLTISAAAPASDLPISWALVADASRSMRIPIVSEGQFRALLRQGGAQETLIDGVPVWQLTGPVPPEVRAASPSALDFVARALHSIVDRLGERDRFALIACAEEAVLLGHSRSGASPATLARGIARLPSLNLGEQTDLAQGIELGLAELRNARATTGADQRVERLLLLTDGFTQHAAECLRLASQARAEGIAISTIGLGGEFQDDLLTEIADRSSGRALFLRKPEAIPRSIAAELAAARAVAARQVVLRAALAEQVALRRATRIRPGLTLLDQQIQHRPGKPGGFELALGDVESNAPLSILLELMAPPHAAGVTTLGQIEAADHTGASATAQLQAFYQQHLPSTPPDLASAAARANALRLQQRALEAASHGNTGEAARLLRAAATRYEALGEAGLAELARKQAAAIEQNRQADALLNKELTYATRRLGEG